MADYTPSRLVRSFERHLRAENRSERTVENYLESLHQAEVFLRSRGRRLEEATKADLEEFLADLLARRSASTAATRYKVLRILYRWLEEEEDVPSPTARMKPPIVPEQPIPVIPSVTLPGGSSRPGPTRHPFRHPTLVGSRPPMPERPMLAARPQMARAQDPPANQGRG
jgi:Phage integrase, N-terminal SAM-like domain